MPGNGGKFKVAVVDDDPSISRVMKIILTANGFDVVLASGGKSGLALARSESPDVILLDVMMPDIDGFEVCRRLKADETTRDIPVIFVSARSEPGAIEEGISLGACAYMTKPFKPDVLLAKISEIGNGAQAVQVE